MNQLYFLWIIKSFSHFILLEFFSLYIPTLLFVQVEDILKKTYISLLFAQVEDISSIVTFLFSFSPGGRHPAPFLHQGPRQPHREHEAQRFSGREVEQRQDGAHPGGGQGAGLLHHQSDARLGERWAGGVFCR